MKEFYLYCVQCGRELAEGEEAMGSACGVIDSDGSFYVDEYAGWQGLHHSPECPQ